MAAGDKVLIARVFLAAALFAFTFGGRPRPAGITIPFRLIDNRIFIDVLLNGRGPYHCLLDTGAGAALHSGVAKELGLQIRDSGETEGVGERSVAMGEASLSSVSIGPLRLRGFRVNVIDTSDERDVFGRVSLDAIIGLPIFRQFVVRIDYGRSEVTFFENAAWRYEGKGARVAFTRPDQIPIVAGTLDGVPAHFGLDTGARTSLLLFAPFVERNGLIAKYRPTVEEITGWGIGGPVRSYVARAGVLAVGPLKITRPVIRLPKQRSGLTTSTHVDGLLGPDVLKRFIIYIDYSRNELIFEPAAVRLPDDSFDRFGAWMGEGEAGFRLLDVIPGSPAAEAGLHAGDEIVSIDGKPAATLDLPSVRNSLRTRPAGTRVAVAVRSGLEVLVKTVVLRDLV